MFEGWIGRTVSVVHKDPKKSFCGILVSCSGESIVLKWISDIHGIVDRDLGQVAVSIRNPLYDKFICQKDIPGYEE